MCALALSLRQHLHCGRHTRLCIFSGAALGHLDFCTVFQRHISQCRCPSSVESPLFTASLSECLPLSPVSQAPHRCPCASRRGLRSKKCTKQREDGQLRSAAQPRARTAGRAKDPTATQQAAQESTQGAERGPGGQQRGHRQPERSFEKLCFPKGSPVSHGVTASQGRCHGQASGTGSATKALSMNHEPWELHRASLGLRLIFISPRCAMRHGGLPAGTHAQLPVTDVDGSEASTAFVNASSFPASLKPTYGGHRQLLTHDAPVHKADLPKGQARPY